MVEKNRSKHEIIDCERCGTTFECKLGDVSNCQCSTVLLSESTRDFLENSFFDCLCSQCLNDLNQKIAALDTQDIEKIPNSYLENGRIVFTETYHLRRGYCCQSGCRHCPYGFKK